MRRRLLIAGLLALGAAFPALACGAASDCTIADGSYRIALPATPEPPAGRPALVYLHGHRGTPEEVMDYTDLRKVADKLGLALIAPRGINQSWSLPDAFAPRRDDIAFINAVVRDAVDRFHLDRSKVLISGFSVGGSMTWYIACAEGRAYAGYIPVAGSFWEPYVKTCTLPMPMIYHYHGLADRTVPMEGRQLSRARQGNTYESFQLLRRIAECPDAMTLPVRSGEMTCAHQICGGATQQLCLHAGDHFIDPAWIESAWASIQAGQAKP